MKADNFLLSTNFAKYIDCLEDEAAGVLFKAIMTRQLGEEPTEYIGDYSDAYIVYMMICDFLDEGERLRTARSEAGKGGGEANRSKGEANESKLKQTKANRSKGEANESKTNQEKEKEIEKEKETEKEDIPPKSPHLDTLITERCFEPIVEDAAKEWLAYKRQRKDKLTEVGFNSWLSQVENNIKKHGADSVIDVINRSMAAGYQGVVWDWLKPRGEPNLVDKWRAAL